MRISTPNMASQAPKREGLRPFYRPNAAIPVPNVHDIRRLPVLFRFLGLSQPFGEGILDKECSRPPNCTFPNLRLLRHRDAPADGFGLR